MVSDLVEDSSAYLDTKFIFRESEGYVCCVEDPYPVWCDSEVVESTFRERHTLVQTKQGTVDIAWLMERHLDDDIVHFRSYVGWQGFNDGRNLRLELMDVQWDGFFTTYEVPGEPGTSTRTEFG